MTAIPLSDLARWVVPLTPELLQRILELNPWLEVEEEA
jgi:hypothetical protein